MAGEKEYLAWLEVEQSGVLVPPALQRQILELKTELGLDHYQFPFGS